MISFARPQSENVETYTVNIALFVGLALVFVIILFVMAPLATVHIAGDLQSDRTIAAGNLPASTAEPRQRRDKPLYLTVRPDLSLAIGNDFVARELLAIVLDAATSGDKGTIIFLRADKTVPYGELIEVINILSKAGYLKVALVGLEKTP